MGHWKARALAAAASTGLLATAAACGSTAISSNGAAASGHLPGVVHLYSIQDASGVAGPVGVDDENGIKLAVSEINATHFLGSTRLTVGFGDSGSNATTAASLATQAVSAHYPVVIGPPDSPTADAVAPILSRAQIPTVFTQAGGPGTLVSNYMFRMTPLDSAGLKKAFSWLQSKGVKTLATIYASDVPTLADLSTEAQTDGSKYGFNVVGTTSVLAESSDISSAVTKVLSYHPQAIFIGLAGAQNATAAAQIAQAGFSGPIISDPAAGFGLNGSTGNGIVWGADWAPGAPFGSVSDAFSKAWTKAYGTTPNNFGAEAYDATYFVARGLKAAGTTDPAKLDQALIAEGKQGFLGVLGQVKVVNGQEITSGLLVKWDNGKIVPLANGS